MASSYLQARGVNPPINANERGYHIVYREHQNNHCPGCGHSQWFVGRMVAECAFCHTALPLEAAPLMAGGHIVRTVRRSPVLPMEHAFAA